MKTTEEEAPQEQTTEQLIHALLDEWMCSNNDRTIIGQQAWLKKTLNQVALRAKRERDREWREKVKEATKLRMACACLKPNSSQQSKNSLLKKTNAGNK